MTSAWIDYQLFLIRYVLIDALYFMRLHAGLDRPIAIAQASINLWNIRKASS